MSVNGEEAGGTPLSLAAAGVEDSSLVHACVNVTQIIFQDNKRWWATNPKPVEIDRKCPLTSRDFRADFILSTS